MQSGIFGKQAQAGQSKIEFGPAQGARKLSQAAVDRRAQDAVIFTKTAAQVKELGVQSLIKKQPWGALHTTSLFDGGIVLAY